MAFLTREQVIILITEAIKGKKVLHITYQHVGKDQNIVSRIKAPFDIGTTNPKTLESNKNNLYAFCFDHIDQETGLNKKIVHPINIEHIISIERTEEVFNENELAEIHRQNTGYDYKTCIFAVLPDRGWFN